MIDDLEKVKVNEEEINEFMPEIYRKLDWLDKEDLIKRVVSHEFNRFFEYYRDKDDIETVSDSKKGRDKEEKKGSRKAEEGYVRLHINLGKIDHFNLRGLMAMLNDNTRRRVDVGRVDLMKKFSFFEVDEKETENVLKAFRGLTWNGRKVVVEVAQEDPKGGDEEEDYGKKSRKRRDRSVRSGRSSRRRR